LARLNNISAARRGCSGKEDAYPTSDPEVTKQDLRTRLANSGQLAGNHQVPIDENGLSNIVRMPGKEWQMTQIFNSDYILMFQFQDIVKTASNIDLFRLIFLHT